MAAEIRVPMLGESVVEATVARWLKAEGDEVAVGEPVVELETEKVNTEVAADEAGVLERLLRQEGETVKPGDVLATIGDAREAAAATPAAAEATEQEPTAAPPGEEGEGKVRASPVAQRLAAEFGVELDQVAGTGPGGRVTREDVEAHVKGQGRSFDRLRTSGAAPAEEAPAPPPAARPEPPARPEPVEGRAVSARAETRQRLSRRRLTIARRLVEAQRTAAMLTTFNEVDMNGVIELRRRRREVFRARHGVDLGFMPFFVKACVGALKAFPQVNAELQGEELVLKGYYDIGIAIGDPEGLVVPVLRDADGMSFADIERAIADFVQRASEHRLRLDELQGGTFTITNGGVFGSLLSTPILNPPQVGILGMHKFEQRPVVVDGQVVVRSMMYLALSYDHRVVDGREAVLFLVRVKELIEDPEQMLLA